MKTWFLKEFVDGAFPKFAQAQLKEFANTHKLMPGEILILTIVPGEYGRFSSSSGRVAIMYYADRELT